MRRLVIGLVALSAGLGLFAGDAGAQDDGTDPDDAVPTDVDTTEVAAVDVLQVSGTADVRAGALNVGLSGGFDPTENVT